MDTAASSLRRGTPRRIAKFAIPVLIIAAVTFNALAVISAINWSQTPFLGILMVPRLIVSNVHNLQWSAQMNGVDSGDVLLAIDNQPVSSARDVSGFLRQYQAGSQVTATFEITAGNREDRILALTSFSLQDQLFYFWIPYAIGLIYLIMGVIVYRFRGATHGGDVFVTLSVFASVLAGGAFDQYTHHLLTPFWTFVLPLTAAALIHLALVFPARNKIVRRRPWLRLIPYGLALALGIISLYGLYLSPDPHSYLLVWILSLSLVALSIPLYLALLLYTLYSSFVPLVRRQTMIMFWFTPDIAHECSKVNRY